MVCSNRCSLRLQERNAVRWFSEKCEILTPVVFITQGLSNSGTSFILFYIKWLASGAMMNHSLMIRSGHLVSCFNLKDRTAYHIHNCCFFDSFQSSNLFTFNFGFSSFNLQKIFVLSTAYTRKTPAATLLHLSLAVDLWCLQ